MVLDVSWESSTFVIKPGEFARIPQLGNFISERAFFDTYLFLHICTYKHYKLYKHGEKGKGGSVKETLMYDYQHRFYLLFVFLFFYLFQELSFLVFESLGVS